MLPAAVPQIEWFRTVYVPVEDRLRLACALQGGDSDILWMTQRLTNALSRELLAWLDRNVAKDRAGAFAHSIAQQSAVAKPVKPRTEQLPEKPGWLVHNVNLKPTDTGVILTFKDNGSRAVAIRFDAVHLRRWLQGVHVQYRKANWPTDVWPTWIAEAAEEQPEPRLGRLH